jgi:hypothetical protein
MERHAVYYGRTPRVSEDIAPFSPRGPLVRSGQVFKKQIRNLGEKAEQTTKNIAVSLNVGVIIAAVSLLVSMIALVVSIGRNS